MPAWLADAAARHPDRVAVVDRDGVVTYAELLSRARGCVPASAVGTAPTTDTVARLHAALLADRPVIPVDERLTGDERDARRATAAPAGAAFVLFTSGTTGAPKPVAITPGQIAASAAATAARLGTGTWLSPLPLAHVGGLMALLRPLLAGTTALLGPADWVTRDDVDFASLVPTQLARLLDAGLRAPRARVILGGAPPPPGLLARAEAAGVRVSVTYGMTETCSMVALDGVPLDGAQITLAADGEIVVRGAMVSGGAHRTGDLGRLDGDGVLHVVGRKADTIVSGGENVAPAEVEAVLLAHPDVADAAVVGRPDAEWGEAVTALIVPRAGTHLNPDELRAFCRARLAPFKVPKAFAPAAALPRTAGGKLRRRDIR